MDLYTIKLENGNTYRIIDTIVNKEDKYLVLAMDNLEDFTIRKVVIIDNEECLVKLDSVSEYEKVMTIFYNKHMKGMN